MWVVVKFFVQSLDMALCEDWAKLSRQRGKTQHFKGTVKLK
jgi:hypothetical protein